MAERQNRQVSFSLLLCITYQFIVLNWDVMHKSKEKLTGLFCLSAILFYSASFSEQMREDFCNLASLPEPVQQILAQKFPGWRVWGSSDLTKEEREHWSKSKNTSDCPGLAVGHFENKEYLSYAFSLVPVDAEKRGWRLIVLTRNKEAAYQEKIIDKHDDLTGTGVLYKAPPGKYMDPE